MRLSGKGIKVLAVSLLAVLGLIAGGAVFYLSVAEQDEASPVEKTVGEASVNTELALSGPVFDLTE